MDCDFSRRDFIATSATAATTATLLSGGVFAKGDDTIKIGLVGCGGRGGGAASDALYADDNVKLYAMADVFADHIQSCEAQLKKRHKDRVDVPQERRFVGLDGYQKVIDTCDVVLLCSPPGFRPLHMKAAVEAGKHVFAEKPMAVDGPGVRSVLETAELAKKKNVGIVVGYTYRFDKSKRETMKRLLDGAVGEILAAQISYNTGRIWLRDVKPEWTTVQKQLLNWYYYTWLSGDFIVEQHCHNIDKACWAMNGKYPIAATGLGGRQVRTGDEFGHIYDHFSIVYEYENGSKVFSYCRQIEKCKTDVSDTFFCTKGRVILNESEGKNRIFGLDGQTILENNSELGDAYVQEHRELLTSIRAGKPLNNCVESAYSTLMAVLGRQAAYTGQRLTWEQMLQSKENLYPEGLTYETSLPKYKVAMPGITKFV